MILMSLLLGVMATVLSGSDGRAIDVAIAAQGTRFALAPAHADFSTAGLDMNSPVEALADANGPPRSDRLERGDDTSAAIVRVRSEAQPPSVLKVAAETAGHSAPELPLPPSVTVYGAKCDSNGTAGTGTDDSAAFATADAKGLGLTVPGKCRISNNMTIRSRVNFGPNGQLVTDTGTVVTLTSPNGPVAGKTQQIFAGSGRVVLTGARYVSVAWWGAQSAADAAPAFRAAIGSNRTIDGAGGNYTFRSTERVPAPYTHIDPPSVLMKGLSNFTFDLTNSTITTGSPVINNTQFMIDRSRKFHVIGGTFAGTTEPNHENTAFVLENDKDFSFSRQVFSGNWGGIAAPFAGNWLVNGRFTDLQMDGVGQCFDLAQVHNLYFYNVRAVGAGNGGIGTGQKCFSFYNDNVFTNWNFTDVSWTDVNNCIVLRGNRASNFNAGFVAAAGTNYLLNRNVWSDNPGTGQVSGYGILLDYMPSGQYSSVNVPVSNVTIDGDTFTGNGRAKAGSGILVNSRNIVNKDEMQNIVIKNSVFHDNADTAIQTSSAHHTISFRSLNNTFSGANQTQAVSPNFTAGAGASKNRSSLNESFGEGCSVQGYPFQ